MANHFLFNPFLCIGSQTSSSSCIHACPLRVGFFGRLLVLLSPCDGAVFDLDDEDESDEEEDESDEEDDEEGGDKDDEDGNDEDEDEDKDGKDDEDDDGNHEKGEMGMPMMLVTMMMIQTNLAPTPADMESETEVRVAKTREVMMMSMMRGGVLQMIRAVRLLMRSEMTRPKMMETTKLAAEMMMMPALTASTACSCQGGAQHHRRHREECPPHQTLHDQLRHYRHHRHYLWSDQQPRHQHHHWRDQ